MNTPIWQLRIRRVRRVENLVQSCMAALFCTHGSLHSRVTQTVDDGHLEASYEGSDAFYLFIRGLK